MGTLLLCALTHTLACSKGEKSSEGDPKKLEPMASQPTPVPIGKSPPCMPYPQCMQEGQPGVQLPNGHIPNGQLPNIGKSPPCMPYPQCMQEGQPGGQLPNGHIPNGQLPNPGQGPPCMPYPRCMAG